MKIIGTLIKTNSYDNATQLYQKMIALSIEVERNYQIYQSCSN